METKKCLVELDEVMKHLSNKDLEKIPFEIREAIKEKKDKEYIWEYDETKKLTEQNLNRKTIIMLSYLNMEFLVNEEQKQVLKELHEFNEQKSEEEKKKKYNSNNLFNPSNDNKTKNALIIFEEKENKWYKKVISFLKKIFKR